jgi:hypothetical protein
VVVRRGRHRERKREKRARNGARYEIWAPNLAMYSVDHHFPHLSRIWWLGWHLFVLLFVLQGNWVVKRKTAASRFTRAVGTIAHWCRLHRHRPIPEQHQTLCRKLRGHYAYYGITGNSMALSRFREEVRRLWWRWMGGRRSGNRPTVSWFTRLLARYPIPNAVALQSVCRRRSEGVS